MSAIIPTYTADAFTRMLLALWPPGRYATKPGPVLYAFHAGLAQELERHHQRQLDLIEESFPETTDELIENWEKEYGLTDSSGTLDERRTRLLTRILAFVAQPGKSNRRPADYRTIFAPILDLNPAQVVVVEITAAQAATAGNPRLVYQFYIYRNPALPGMPDLVFAQAELDRIQHSHTRGVIIESLALLCDDPFSLTDRDPLGI